MLIPIPFGTPSYDEAVALRQQVLRAPLGLAFEPEELCLEAEQWHLGWYAADWQLLACVSFAPLPESDSLKLRQMAVQPQQQGKGRGTALIRAAEAFVFQKGYRKLKMHAREVAVPFYQRLGYTVEGPRFEEVGLPHLPMGKVLGE